MFVDRHGFAGFGMFRNARHAIEPALVVPVRGLCQRPGLGKGGFFGLAQGATEWKRMTPSLPVSRSSSPL